MRIGLVPDRRREGLQARRHRTGAARAVAGEPDHPRRPGPTRPAAAPCHKRGSAAASPASTTAAAGRPGISIDQAVANASRHRHPRSSRSRPASSSRATSSTPCSTAAPGRWSSPRTIPAKMFARLFSAGVPAPAGRRDAGPVASAEFARLRARRKSILDRAMEEYKRLPATVGGGDQHRLDAAHGRHPCRSSAAWTPSPAAPGTASARLQDARRAPAATDFQPPARPQMRAAGDGAGL